MKAAFVLALAALIATPAYAEKTNRKVASKPHECAEDAIEKAGKLLRFHFGGDDDRIVIHEEVKQLAPVKSPNGKRKYPVLEVQAEIYKGSYHMRFIYGDIEGCVLLGQEIMEETNL